MMPPFADASGAGLRETQKMRTELLRRITLAAALAVSASVGVAAQAQPSAPQRTERGTLTLNFDAKSCTESDRAAVIEAYSLARERSLAGLQLVRENPNDPRITRWFGDSSRKRIAEVLEATVRRIDQPRSFTVSCNTAYCQQRQPMAYTSHNDRIVGFCRGFFRAALTGEDSRFGAVVHEMSHLAARTQDHVYSRPNARMLAAKEPTRAADNADSYEYFIETLTE